MTPKGHQESAATEDPDAAIGRRIREAREARGYSQQAVSTRSKWAAGDEKGISRTALIGYEAGTSRPGTRELRILCETLHVTPNFLLYGSENPFEALDAARDGIRTGGDIREVVQLAFVLAALKGHEKDALTSLVLALAGRQLGDARLGGLRSTALMMVPSIEAAIVDAAGTDAAEAGASLEAIIEKLSHGATSNLGNRLVFDEEGEVVGGKVTYPDPQQPTPPERGKS